MQRCTPSTPTHISNSQQNGVNQNILSLRERFINPRTRNSGNIQIQSYTKQENDQANDANDKSSSITKVINVTTPTKPIRISSDIFPPTPNSSKSSSDRSLQFASGNTTPNSISNGVLSDIINNRRERENSTSPTRRLNIQQNPTSLSDTTEMSPANPINPIQETSVIQDKIDGEITPAAFPTCSKQEDKKNERLRKFREQYSLQQPNNNNTNKRKRIESHDNVETSKIHPVDRHLLPVEPECMDKLKQIMLYLRRFHMKAIHEAKARSQTIKSQLKSNINRYDISLWIDPAILLEFDPILGHRLLNNFVATHLNEDLTEACLFILQSTFGPDEILMAEQVRSKIRLEYFPDLPEYRMNKYLMAFHKTRDNKDPLFAIIRGIVECVWMPTFVIFSRTFNCDNPGCRNKNYLHVVPSARTNRVIKRTEDKEYLNTSTSATLHDIDLYCSHCGQEMKEIVVDRVYTIRQRIRLSCVDGDENDGSFTNAVYVLVEDELVNKVEVGQFIRVIGLVGRHFPTLDDGKFCTRSWYDNGLHVEVNNIKRVSLNEARHAKRFSFNDEHHSYILPDVIVSLQKANLSAWAFTQRLVDVFCDDIVPQSTYRKIKLFLLLSLVALSDQRSKKPGISPNVHFMILSNGYNPIVPRMIRRVSELKRHEEWTHGLDKKKQPLFIIQDGQNVGKEVFIESTILANSRDGILLVNLDTLGKKDVESLRLVMDKSSKLSVQNRHHQIGIDLNTCCWGLSVTKISDKGTSSNNDEGIDRICNDAIKPIIDTFDLVIHLNESINSETNELIVDHLLEQATVSLEEKNHKEKLAVLTFEEFKQFIAVASSIEVKLSTECKDILRKYFLICRKLKGASQGFASSTALLESLLRIASCHAKLCLRSVGSVDDALVSILVIEETLVAKYGSSASVLGFAPLQDDQENIHKLYASEKNIFEHIFPDNESNHSSMDQTHQTNNQKLSGLNNLNLVEDEENVFCTLVQNISKTDNDEMAKMYQHLVRILHSFGDGDGDSRMMETGIDVTDEAAWNQLELIM